MRKEMRYEIRILRQEIRHSKDSSNESSNETGLVLLQPFEKVGTIDELNQAEAKFLSRSEENVSYQVRLVSSAGNEFKRKLIYLLFRPLP